ncbi:AEL_HP2_G0048220.mRNA.1.CDS.1 [Saccharomyces cerevisiae]|nr:AEL_HP2_G0048220.mRNA.1.CDS.1 [Saccharomyces cerevisiae]CAI6778886.1 AEL_HP2_G0048220.mRNA.1.CDS.1 [Saccharomyces cerevisiae]
MTDEKRAFPKGNNHIRSETFNGSVSHKISESIKDIASLRPHGKYTVQDIDNIIASTSSHENRGQSGDSNGCINHDEEGDIPMCDLNDESDVEMISEYLSNQREMEAQSVAHSMPKINDDLPLLNPPTLKTAFVVDTNFIISHLNTLEKLRSLSSTYHHLIIVPTTVIQGLDGLKKSPDIARDNDDTTNQEQDRTIGTLARWGNDWIYKNLANLDSGLIGQKLKQSLNPGSLKDDSILDCCLYFKEILNCFVILLSNDKNLCTKALTEDILTVSFRKNMDAKIIAMRAYEENQLRFANLRDSTVNNFDQNVTSYAHIPGIETPPLQFDKVSQNVFEQVKETIFFAIDHTLRKEYGEDIGFIDYNPDKLTTIENASNYIYLFWVSVFSELFTCSKIKKNEWKSLPTVLKSKPTNLNDLRTFEQFWETVLHFLFSKFTNEEKQSLEKQIHEWKTSINAIST